MLFKKNFKKRSQDLKQIMCDAAQFYWGKPNAWRNQLKVFDRSSYPIMLPRWRVQDIDTPDDWDRAEAMAQVLLADNIKRISND